jgi:hypothetical protein
VLIARIPPYIRLRRFDMKYSAFPCIADGTWTTDSQGQIDA